MFFVRLFYAFIRAENEIRTRDPQLGKLMLYQLSYFRLYFGNKDNDRNWYYKTIF